MRGFKFVLLAAVLGIGVTGSTPKGDAQVSVDIGVAGVVAATPVCPSVEVVREWVVKLKQGLDQSERDTIDGVLRDAVPDFRSEAR